jgi:hypothetical protein
MRRRSDKVCVDPCLPTLGMADRSLWGREIKHDSYRFICRHDGDLLLVWVVSLARLDRPGFLEAALRLRVSSASFGRERSSQLEEIAQREPGEEDAKRTEDRLNKGDKLKPQGRQRHGCACGDRSTAANKCRLYLLGQSWRIFL